MCAYSDIRNTQSSPIEKNPGVRSKLRPHRSNKSGSNAWIHNRAV